jgi:hypothetical protein
LNFFSKVQQRLEEEEVTESLLNQEKEANQQLHHSLRREEEHWRLKSRSLWLKAGDSNTSFFHKQAQNRRKKIQLLPSFQILDNNLIPLNKSKKQAFQHFDSLYQHPSNEGTNEEAQEMLANIPNIVSEHDNNQLVREITEEEIAKAVWDMDPDKAPGPDGFSIRFYRSFWATMVNENSSILSLCLFLSQFVYVNLCSIF